MNELENFLPISAAPVAQAHVRFLACGPKCPYMTIFEQIFNVNRSFPLTFASFSEFTGLAGGGWGGGGSATRSETRRRLVSFKLGQFR